MDKNEQWLKWAVELQAIAQGGLFYGKDKFFLLFMLAHLKKRKISQKQRRYLAENSYLCLIHKTKRQFT